MPEPVNNPMAIEQYNSLNPTDIHSGGYTIQNLISKQLDRIDFLLTMGTARTLEHQYFNDQQMAQAVKRGLRTVESYLASYLEDDKEYTELINTIKTRIKQTERSNQTDELLDTLSNWMDLLISRLGNLDMLPQKRTEIEFE